MAYIFLLLFSFSIAFFVTQQIRNFALSKNMLDIPNQRSSHKIPTPRGGGVSIVISFFSCLLVLTTIQFIDTKVALALFLGGFLVALVGFLDDRHSLSPKWRILVHFFTAGMALYFINPTSTVTLFNYQVDFGLFIYILFGLYFVWMINLYNFMDGIDGIASIEAISICCGITIILLLKANNDYHNLFFIPLLASSVLGFIFWNFPKAKIFMGDAGSGFLGFTLAAFSVIAAQFDPTLLFAFLICLGVFIVDASITVIIRFLKGKKVYEAHCSHAYQYASRLLQSHIKVSISVGCINIFWLLPFGALTALEKIDGLTALIIAYAPLVLAAFYLKAGDEIQQRI